MDPFTSVDAEFALMRLWKDVRSKPEDPEYSRLEIPSASTERAVASIIAASAEFAKATPPIRIPFAFTPSAVKYLLTPSRCERQVLVLSIADERFDANRRLIAFSVPDEIAKQIFRLSVATDTSPQVLPPFNDSDAVDTSVAMSDSNSTTPDARALTKETARRRLLELLEPNDTVRMVSISNVIQTPEVAIAVKLINILACEDTKQLYASVTGVSRYDLGAAHWLLDRFAFPVRTTKNFEPEFTAGDVAAAHQLRALFSSDDPSRDIGPLFLVFPEGPCGQSKQLVLLSDGDGAQRHLFEAFRKRYPGKYPGDS